MMASLTEYHTQLATTLTPWAEAHPDALSERAQGVLEGYLRALDDLHRTWATSSLWYSESRRTDWAAHLARITDALAARLRALPAAAGAAP